MVELRVLGLTKPEVKTLIDDLNSIDGVKAGFVIKESVIEFKSIFTDIVINLIIPVGVSIISHCIIKFFEKTKTQNNKPIIINYNNIQIIQGESLEEIENKVSIIINNKD